MKRGVLFGAVPVAIGSIVGLFMAPSGPSAPLDPDLSGKGLLNRTYAYQAYQAHNDTPYLMVRDRDRYELYQWVKARGRAELISDYTVARQIVEDMVRLTANTLNDTELMGRTTNTRVKMWQCDGLSEPVTAGGQIFRTERSCPYVENTGAGLREQYTRANGFWTAALNGMTPDNYGPAQASLQTLPPTNPEAGNPVLETATDAGLLGLGLWAGIGAIGAGAAGLRRRAGNSNTTYGRRR